MHRKTWARTGGAVQWRIGRISRSMVFRDRKARSTASRAVQHLKGRSSHKLLSEFGILRKRYWVPPDASIPRRSSLP